MGYRNYAPANGFIVAKDGNGDFSTIAAALTAATSGQTIFIRPGTYTENLTLKAGVNLTAFECDASTPNVIILGKATATFAGACTITGIQLKTNSDFFLVVSGSSATSITLKDCYLNCNNNTGISLTSSSASAGIGVYDSFANLATTGIAYHSSSSAGVIAYWNCSMTNTGGSTTASDNSAGIVSFDYCLVTAPISSSSTATLVFQYTRVDTSAQNATPVTFNGSNGNSGAINSFFFGGTNPGITIGASGNIQLIGGCTVQSSNTNAISGSGALTYNTIHFSTSAMIQSTITQTLRPMGTQLQIGNSTTTIGTSLLTTSAFSGGNNSMTIQNTSNTANSQALMQMSVAGSTAGDAYAVFSGPSNWSCGMDNSDSDAWVLTPALTLGGATNAIRAATTGNVDFPTSISVAGGSALSVFTQGTFSPTMRGSGTAGTVTMTTQVGRYQKIGNVANVQIRADWSTIGTATGSAQCNNLPFTDANNTSAQLSLVVADTNPLTTATNAVAFMAPNANAATANINYVIGAGGAGAGNAAGVITATNGFETVLIYETT